MHKKGFCDPENEFFFLILNERMKFCKYTSYVNWQILRLKNGEIPGGQRSSTKEKKKYFMKIVKRGVSSKKDGLVKIVYRKDGWIDMAWTIVTLLRTNNLSDI